MVGAVGDMIATGSWAWTVRISPVVFVIRTEIGKRLGGDICCQTRRPIVKEIENVKFACCWTMMPVSAQTGECCGM